jgi:hypothetical protein
MKIVGTGTFDANRTTTTNSLGAAILTRPEIAANLANIWEGNYTAFSSLLARKGLVKRNVFAGLDSKDFKVIGNRKFMWGVKGYPFTKCYITAAHDMPAGVTNPGEAGTIVTIYLNANYFSPNDVLELSDGTTQVIVMDEYPEEVNANEWAYKVKLVTNVAGDYIDTALLAVDQEVGFLHTAFPEMSETGYEKNQFPEWRTEYMTIQRMQYSISGSAKHTKVYWVEHNGQLLWFKEQELEMMRRWGIARENQLLFGKATIDANENTYLRDLKGREIIAGSGVVNQGDASLKYSYNKLSIRTIETIMQNMQLLDNGTGANEVVVQGGQAFTWEFDRLMRDVFKMNPQPLFISDAEKGRGVRSNFNRYEIGGVSLVVSWNKTIDAPWKADSKDAFGVSKRSKEAYFFAMGTVVDQPNIELVALGNASGDRAMIKKEIPGMVSIDGSRGGITSNSVDGTQVQILSETGVKLENEWGIASLKSR